MRKIILNKEQVAELVWNNRYKVDPKEKFLSRCVDGRYPTSPRILGASLGASQNLPALAIPGADAGELALIFATANTFGFELNQEKTIKVMLDIVGGIRNFNFHTDHHGSPKILASGCGHMKQIGIDPAVYNLDKEQVKFMQKMLKTLKKQGAKEMVLEGEHLEGVILQIKGPYSIYPRFFVETEGGRTAVEAFCFHSGLVDERHRFLAKKLLEEKAVKLFPGCDEEYLYEVLSDTTENHLFETLKRLAPELPIFSVVFKEDGSFAIEEMGKINNS